MSNADFLVARLIDQQVNFLHAAERIEGGTDNEALHDLRIALRGASSLLLPLRNHPGLARLDQAVADLLRRTSALRDAQVLAEELERRGWQVEADKRRQKVEETCRRCMHGRVARRVNAEFERWPTELRLVDAETGLRKLKRRIGRRMERDLQKLREALVLQGSCTNDWHVLRLRIKRVRYLCESYADWLTAKRKLLEELKRAQTALGSERDLSLWCSAAEKDPSLQPLLTTWLVSKVDAQRDVRTAMDRLLKCLDDRRGRKGPVAALSPVVG